MLSNLALWTKLTGKDSSIKVAKRQQLLIIEDVIHLSKIKKKKKENILFQIISISIP